MAIINPMPLSVSSRWLSITLDVLRDEYGPRRIEPGETWDRFLKLLAEAEAIYREDDLPVSRHGG